MAATITRSSGFNGGSPGGNTSAVNVTTAAVLKTGNGVLCTVIPLASGTLTINDCATTGAAATANQMFTGSVTAGQVINLNAWPFFLGLCISALPAQIAVSFS